jgi:hypothetical protein
MPERARLKSRPAIILIFAMLLSSHSIAGGESPPSVFSTWDIFEVDKLASIWLLKRFVNPKVKIKLYPKGDTITEGIPFDTPEAKFRRYHNMSTYEMFRRHFDIDDPRCIYISKIVHDVEINTWEKKVMSESRSVIDAIKNIITDSSTSEEIINRAIMYFDRLYADLAHVHP